MTFDEHRARTWELAAHIEWGHQFTVDPADRDWQTCRRCGAQMANDGQFEYPGRCPTFWDGDTLRPPDDGFLDHARHLFDGP